MNLPKKQPLKNDFALRPLKKAVKTGDKKRPSNAIMAAL